MVQLIDAEVHTREVLDWRGLHLFHAQISSCSQKLRIFLNLKGLPWESHPVDLAHNENLTEYFLGINPRGLVPVLVDDGQVHIESNDILLHLEQRFPEPQLIPSGAADDVRALLKEEDDLHLDLRALSFRFLFMPPPGLVLKSEEELGRYATLGSTTIGGVADTHKAQEIAFWQDYTQNQGVPDDRVRAAAASFRKVFGKLDERLASSPYLVDKHMSVVDIAWIVYAQRLTLAGYPLARLHPRLAKWLQEQLENPAIGKEVALPGEMAPHVAQAQAAMAAKGLGLEQVCQL